MSSVFEEAAEKMRQFGDTAAWVADDVESIAEAFLEQEAEIESVFFMFGKRYAWVRNEEGKLRSIPW